MAADLRFSSSQQPSRVGRPGRASHSGHPSTVRAADGSGELHLPSYDRFSATEVLRQMAFEKMLAPAFVAALCPRAGARRAGRRGAGRRVHLEVGGSPVVSRRDRDRAGAADDPATR
jgi:hypothetical protein